MLERLGNLLYWIGCGVTIWILIVCAAAIILPIAARYIFASPAQIDGPHFDTIAIVAAFSLVPYGIGRACRYVLAGR